MISKIQLGKHDLQFRHLSYAESYALSCGNISSEEVCLRCLLDESQQHLLEFLDPNFIITKLQQDAEELKKKSDELISIDSQLEKLQVVEDGNEEQIEKVLALNIRRTELLDAQLSANDDSLSRVINKDVGYVAYLLCNEQKDLSIEAYSLNTLRAIKLIKEAFSQ